MKTLSLEGRFVFFLVGTTAIGILCGALATWLLENLWLGLALGGLVGILAALFVGRGFTKPVTRILQALADGVASFKDGDFSVSLGTDRQDELGDLVAAYNEVGNVLRRERQNLFQRELLLDSVIQASPVAMLLADPHDRIVYSNPAARQFFNDGHRLEGMGMQAMVADKRPELALAVSEVQEGLFTVETAREEDIYHVSHGQFSLNGRRHHLVLFKAMTHEINRQEVSTWKKVIRVISHELNNSLAPISSLAHSGQELNRRNDSERLASVFRSIEERSQQLKGFIEGYAKFAKLPTPEVVEVDLEAFVEQLAAMYSFTLDGDLPERTAWFDAAQLQQVMLNLLKNASESGSAPEHIHLAVQFEGPRLLIRVMDQGDGMSENVLRHALVPFYSTKKAGSGLGLPLCREIIEAHGGRLALRNRKQGGLEASFWLPQPAPR
ncbi:MAG: ATP-binding protein [Gammaproteobacteria bacterium]|nr:ATP-binding protein [Gammaproteobacteria bacterium]